MNALALTDDTGYGKTSGSEADSFFDELRGVFHIISPGSCLCAPGRRKNQPSLAHCLAVENNPLLTQVLAQVNDVKVIFINGHDSVMATEQKKYEQMTSYRQAMHLPETKFTIRSLLPWCSFSSAVYQSCFSCVFFDFPSGKTVYTTTWAFKNSPGPSFRISTVLLTIITSRRDSLLLCMIRLYPKQ